MPLVPGVKAPWTNNGAVLHQLGARRRIGVWETVQTVQKAAKIDPFQGQKLA
jgi:hypothetical protein